MGTLRESSSAQRFLASKLNVKPGDKVWTWVRRGGPLEIAAFTGGGDRVEQQRVPDQARRGDEQGHGQHENCDFVKGFHEDPQARRLVRRGVPDRSHLPRAGRGEVLLGDLRVLKPGGVFASYEWCLTDAYDPTNAEHRRIRQEILIGNGLPTARTCEDVLTAMKKAGFEILEEQDLVKTADISWYEPIDPYRAWRPWRDFWSFKTTIGDVP